MEDLFDTILSMSDARTGRRKRSYQKDSSLAEHALREAMGADLNSNITASNRDWLDLDHAIAARSTRGTVADEFEYEEDWHRGKGLDEDIHEGDRSFEENDS